MFRTLLLLVLLCVPAAAADVAPSPSPSPEAALAVARAAIQAARDAMTRDAAARKTEIDKAAAQLAASEPVPIVVAPATVSIPADIRDGLVSLASLLITGMLGIFLTWARAHMTFMKNVAMNQEVTASAQDFGALLVQDIKAKGLPATIDISNPAVAAFTKKVFDNYPAYAAALKITPDKVATLILKGAAKVLPPSDPVPVIASPVTNPAALAVNIPHAPPAFAGA